jgi:hypothetical protein
MLTLDSIRKSLKFEDEIMNNASSIIFIIYIYIYIIYIIYILDHKKLISDTDLDNL